MFKPMHILFLSPGFPPLPGGGERYAYALAEKLAQAGHRISVVTSSAETESAFWLGSPAHIVDTPHPRITIHRLPLTPFRGGRNALLLWRKAMVVLSALPGDQSRRLRQLACRFPPIQGLDACLAQFVGKVDIVHGFNISWESAMLSGWQWARQNKLPYVMTPFMHFGVGNNDRVARNALMNHQRQMMADADALFTLTTVAEQELQRREVRQQAIYAVGGGLDALPDLLPQAEVLDKFGLEKPYVIFIGRNNYDKGAIDAVKAVLRLRQEGKAVRLALVGQRTDEMDKALKGLDSAEALFIHPLGLVTEREKHTLLNAATALLLPSRVESFGIVFLEAWAHKKPVIGARAGGIPGVVSAGKDGLLIPFGDVPALANAIATLLDDEVLCRTLGQNGFNQLETKFSWDNVSAKTLAVYQKLHKEK